MSGMETNEYREQRLQKMKKLAEMGHAPFGRAFDRTGSLADIRAAFEEKREVSAAGRLTTIRDMGKSLFADIRDGSDRFQVYANGKAMGDEAFLGFKLLDIGDIIGVTGALFTTRTGERTIQITRWQPLAKALRPLPEKWHGLADVEARHRERHLDLIANPETRTLFNRRSEIVREIRAFLQERGFQEVETPMMQPLAGGAAARPFATHYHALNAEMYLRIAPELYLKRLLVGGFDRIFELNRNFRNEGLSRTHNPEFTMLEIYEAYSDVRGMQRLVETLIPHVAMKVTGGMKTRGAGGQEIDLTPPWREATYRELIEERMGKGWFALSVEEARRRAEGEGLTVAPEWDHLLVTHEVYEKLVEKTLIQPTLVKRLPSRLIPLAKPCEDDKDLADVFELVIGGQEIAPAYTEMNDPIVQGQRLREQAAAAKEQADEDFLAALEHGMPPAGGMGIGIDRLVMIVTGAESIRDVILFPQLRPKG